MSERLEISNPLDRIDAIHNQIQEKQDEQQRLADEQAAETTRLAHEATDWNAAIAENTKYDDRLKAWAQPEPYITPTRRASHPDEVAPLKEVRKAVADSQSALGRLDKSNPSERLIDRPSHSYIESTTLQDVIARSMGTNREVKTSVANYYESLDEQPYKDARIVLKAARKAPIPYDEKAMLEAALKDAQDYGQEVLADNLDSIIRERAKDAKNKAVKTEQSARDKADSDKQAAIDKAMAELKAIEDAETLDTTKLDKHSTNVLAALSGKSIAAQPKQETPKEVPKETSEEPETPQASGYQPGKPVVWSEMPLTESSKQTTELPNHNSPEDSVESSETEAEQALVDGSESENNANTDDGSAEESTEVEDKIQDENSLIDAERTVKHVEDTIYEGTINRVMKLVGSNDETLTVDSLMKLTGLDKQLATEMFEYVQAKETITQQSQEDSTENTKEDQSTPQNEQGGNVEDKSDEPTDDDDLDGSSATITTPVSQPSQMSILQAKRQGIYEKPTKPSSQEKRLKRMLTNYEELVGVGNKRDGGKIAKLSANIDYLRGKMGDKGDTIAAGNLVYLQRQNQLSGLGKNKILNDVYREAVKNGAITELESNDKSASRDIVERPKSNVKSIRDRSASIAEKIKSSDRGIKARRAGAGALRAYQAVDTKFRIGFDKAYEYRDEKIYGPAVERMKSRRETVGKRLGTLATGARAVTNSRQKLADRREAKDLALVEQRKAAGQGNSSHIIEKLEDTDEISGRSY